MSAKAWVRTDLVVVLLVVLESMSHAAHPTEAMPDHDAWPSFELSWNDSASGPTDMAFLLEKPAGAKGFVHVVDGHLAAGDGKRLRLWGMNVCGSGAMPPQKDADVAVARMAKFGINCLRIHLLDEAPWPRGLLMRRQRGSLSFHGPANESTRAFDPEALARLDWFVACCKRHGIYVDLNLLVLRKFTEADDAKNTDGLSAGAKAVALFDPQLICLQKEYARQLLDHVNPFTGNRYAEEPVVALIEIVNENQLDFQWRQGYLQPAAPSAHTPASNWKPIPASYARDLDRLWNSWLTKRYHDRAALATAWNGDLLEREDSAKGTVRRLSPKEFAKASAAHFHDEATFYFEIERDYYLDMAAYLRNELGVRQPIVADSECGNWGSLEAMAQLDVADTHGYWGYPQWHVGSSPSWSIQQTAMVDYPDTSLVSENSRGAVLGKPRIVSELNETFPHDYACEHIPIIGAYARFQDWDGVFWFTYGGCGDGRRIGHFSVGNDPVKMSQIAAGALMFLRGDAETARRTVRLALPHDWVLESLRHKETDELSPLCLPYAVPGRLALQHRIAVSDFHAAVASPAKGEFNAGTEERIVSDTGELIWEAKPQDGRVLIDTPRHQAVIGRAGRRSTHNLTVDLKTPFASLQLVSLDERPLPKADRMLLVAGARVANTNMKWTDETRSSLVGDNWGKAPTRIEPVVASITLKALENTRSVTLRALDKNGQPTGPEHSFTASADGFTVELPSDVPTVWFLVEAVRDK